MLPDDSQTIFDSLLADPTSKTLADAVANEDIHRQLQAYATFR